MRLAVPSIPISVCELELCQKQQRAAEEEDGCAWRVGGRRGVRMVGEWRRGKGGDARRRKGRIEKENS